MQGLAKVEELHLLSPVTGDWVVLEGPARRIWEMLEYPARVHEVATALGAQYDAPAETIDESVRSILARLVAHGLVGEAPGEPVAIRDRYLRLIKRALANTLYPELEMQIQFLRKGVGDLSGIELERYLRDIEKRRADDYSELMDAKQEGAAPWRFPHSMIGLFRLGNIERCAEAVFAEGVEGDFLEAGVCRGGATIFMRALQIAHGEAERRTWVVDSFQGVPPSVKEVDQGYDLHLEEARAPWLACSEEKVRDLFSRYDMLDPKVEFVSGWVAESLPKAPIGPLAILRIDVDIYSSNYECLDLLYDKVSPGGFVIIDDYGFFEPCRDAVDDFRARRGIVEPIEWIDRWGIFWRKAAAPAA
ncbi:MAG TPA: PqqD family peptide modification chaperone [Allosphingosinicella sp.]